MTDSDGRESYGRASRAQGKRTTVRHQFGTGSTASIKTIRVLGKTEPTNIERERENLLMQMLRGDANPWESKFVRFMWLLRGEDHGLLTQQYQSLACYSTTYSKLNVSQKEVVNAMLSGQPIVIAHGTFRCIISTCQSANTSGAGRAPWYWEDDYHGSCYGAVATTAQSSVHYRTFQRRSEEHR